MYYVENSHEAIISEDLFEAARRELERRAKLYKVSSANEPKHCFTGLIRCCLCGRPYRRTVTASGTKYAKPVWVCWTFFTLGKIHCASQRIPESILIAKTSEVLGCTDWDREFLLQHIAEIQVPEHNRLIYVFHDGHTQEVAWQNPSRRESWTEEMKQKARETALINAKRRRKDD